MSQQAAAAARYYPPPAPDSGDDALDAAIQKARADLPIRTLKARAAARTSAAAALNAIGLADKAVTAAVKETLGGDKSAAAAAAAWSTAHSEIGTAHRLADRALAEAEAHVIVAREYARQTARDAASQPKESGSQ